MVYFVGWAFFLLFFKLYLGFKVVGRHNVPDKGGFILVSNHTSYFDPILLGTALCRSLNYMARENLFKKQCFGWIMRGVHAFPVRRHGGDLGAIKKSLELLAEGKGLVIFPEGTRAKDDNLKEAKPGVGFIVSKANVPVIPAYVGGSFKAMPRGINTLRRHPVAVYFGEPVFFDQSYCGRKDKESYQKISDEIMVRIADLKDSYESGTFSK
jgi:1-acyl-sn-glycerol-3-phosphate acyltransferase